MSSHEHIVCGHLVRRRLYKLKNGISCCRVFNQKTKRLHKVSTRTKVRRMAAEYIRDWIERKEREETEGAILPVRFSEAKEECLRTRQIRGSTRVEYRSCFRQFESLLGKLFLHEIQPEHIERYLRDSEKAERSGRTRQKHLRHLRTFFGWAKLRSYTRKDPTAGLKVPRAAKRAGRAQSIEETRRLVFACRTEYKLTLKNQKGEWGQDYKPPARLFIAVLISVLTGLRRANVLRLRWSHVDLEHRTTRLPAEMMKANADLVIPVHKGVLNYLRQAGPGRADDLVLGTSLRAITKAFKSACERAGLGGLRWHDLRHTFSTWVSEYAPFVVQRHLMGHASSGSMITLDYTHTTFAKLTEAVDQLQLPNLVHPRYVIAGDEMTTPVSVRGDNSLRQGVERSAGGERAGTPAPAGASA